MIYDGRLRWYTLAVLCMSLFNTIYGFEAVSYFFFFYHRAQRILSALLCLHKIHEQVIAGRRRVSKMNTDTSAHVFHAQTSKMHRFHDDDIRLSR